MKNLVLGIDVGGTNVKLGVVNPQGKIVAHGNLSTREHFHSRAKLIQALIAGTKNLLTRHRLSA